MIGTIISPTSIMQMQCWLLFYSNKLNDYSLAHLELNVPFSAPPVASLLAGNPSHPNVNQVVVEDIFKFRMRRDKRSTGSTARTGHQIGAWESDEDGQ